MLGSRSITFRRRGRRAARAATHVLVLTDVSVRVDRRRWRIDLKVVTPTPLLIDLDPAPWHAREGSAERDQRKLEAIASPDYIRVRQSGLLPLVGRTRVVSDRKKLDPWEWAAALRDDVVAAGGAWATVSEHERANARGRAFDHWQRLIARGPDPAAIDVAPALAPEFLANLTFGRGLRSIVSRPRRRTGAVGDVAPVPTSGRPTSETGSGALVVRGAPQLPSRWLGDRLRQVNHCLTPTQTWPSSSSRTSPGRRLGLGG